MHQFVVAKGLLPIRSIPPPLVLAGLPVEGATTELVLPGSKAFLGISILNQIDVILQKLF